MSAREFFTTESKEGYDACLYNIKRNRNPYLPDHSKPALDWFRGWDTAARELGGKLDANTRRRLKPYSPRKIKD